MHYAKPSLHQTQHFIELHIQKCSFTHQHHILTLTSKHWTWIKGPAAHLHPHQELWSLGETQGS